MKHKLGLSALALSLAVAAPAFAEEKTSNWSGSGEAGFNKQTGNSPSTTLLARLKLNYALDLNEFKSLFELENKKTDGIKTSERYLVDLQYNRYFNQDKTFYGFVNTRGEQDKIAGTDMDAAISAGLGKVLYQTDASKLSGEAGIGYQDVKFVNPAHKDFDQVTFRGKLDFEHKFNEIFSFGQDALYLGGSDSYKIVTNSSLRAALSKQLSAAISYQYRYNDKVAAGAKKTETETNFSVIYNF